MCGFVAAVGGERRVFAKEKNGKKRGMCVEGALGAVSKSAYAGALGQTYVRQSLLVAPPRFTLSSWWPWLF